MLYIIQHKVIVTESKEGHSSESYWTALCCSAVYYVVEGSYYFWEKISKGPQTKMLRVYTGSVNDLISQKYKWLFLSLDKILKCGPPNENYWAVLSCETVYLIVHGGRILRTFCEIGNLEEYRHKINKQEEKVNNTLYLFFLEGACVPLSTFPSPHAGILEKWERKTLE